MNDFSSVWIQSINDIMDNGDEVSPRGKLTKEIPQRTITVDMRRPILCVPERKLSYKFMAAEAYWILSGDNRVETIAPYNKRIGHFSDDGITFFGAYGPKIVGQIEYVVSKLLSDRDTRQAGLTIWRENPPDTKDVPCTVAIFFNIRDNKLNANVFMRSNDVWLGTPYDVFNFSMLSHLICGMLNEANPHSLIITPGNLYLTAASSHLYATDWDKVATCGGFKATDQPKTPKLLWSHPDELMKRLKTIRDNPGEGRWWE